MRGRPPKDDNPSPRVLRNRANALRYERQRRAVLNAAKSMERHTVRGLIRNCVTTVTADTEAEAADFLRRLGECV